MGKGESFECFEDALREVHDRFLEQVSLLRENAYIPEQKLEVYPQFNDNGVIESYYFAGKVKFGEGILVEEEDEDILYNNFITVMKYMLNQGEFKKRKSTKRKDLSSKIRREKWFLTKVKT